MDRRWAGLLILVLVVVAAIAIPSARGKLVAGYEELAPIPGPPAVGDCASHAISGTDQLNPSATYPPQKLGACGGRVYGEMVALLVDRRSDSPAQPTVGAPADGSTVTDDPNQLPCLDATTRYLGLTVGADHAPMIVSYWRSLGGQFFSLSGPSPIQRAAGQRWVACIVSLRDQEGGAQPYAGTLRNTFVRGNAPAALALCLDTSDLTSPQPAACDKPHHVEVFGVADTARPGLTQGSLDTSCLGLARRLTRMSDPSAHGQIELRALTVHGPDGTPVAGLGSSTDESGYAACVALTPKTHQLRETLLALGNNPIPWLTG